MRLQFILICAQNTTKQIIQHNSITHNINIYKSIYEQYPTFFKNFAWISSRLSPFWSVTVQAVFTPRFVTLTRSQTSQFKAAKHTLNLSYNIHLGPHYRQNIDSDLLKSLCAQGECQGGRPFPAISFTLVMNCTEAIATSLL